MGSECPVPRSVRANSRACLSAPLWKGHLGVQHAPGASRCSLSSRILGYPVPFRGAVVGWGMVNQAPPPPPYVAGLLAPLPAPGGKISFVYGSGFGNILCSPWWGQMEGPAGSRAPAAGAQDLCLKVHLNGNPLPVGD